MMPPLDKLRSWSVGLRETTLPRDSEPGKYSVHLNFDDPDAVKDWADWLLSETRDAAVTGHDERA